MATPRGREAQTASRPKPYTSKQYITKYTPKPRQQDHQGGLGRTGRELPDVVALQHCLGLGAVDGVELVRGVLPRHYEDAVRAARVLLHEGRAVVHLWVPTLRV